MDAGAFPALRELCLDANAMGTHAAAALGVAMRNQRLPLLELLYLNDNPLGDDGCSSIFAPDALCACPMLRELCANGVGLSTSAGKAAQALLVAAIEAGAAPALKRLNLINNAINDAGVLGLARALGACAAGKQLKRLQLENNAWGADGLAALVDELRNGRLPSLEALEIHGNKKCKDAEGMREAAEAAVQAGLQTFKIGMISPFDQAFKEAKARAAQGSEAEPGGDGGA